MTNFNKLLPDENELIHSLKTSDTLLKNLIESPKNVVVLALDRQYRYILFNQFHQQTMKQIWGFDIKIGESMLTYIISPDDRLKAKNNFDRALSGESFSMEEEYGDVEKDRRFYENNYNPIFDEDGMVIGLSIILTDITDRKRNEEERNRLIQELQEALDKIKVLSGLVPVCSNCKKIRDDQGYWNQIETYIEQHSDVTFSHGYCPECMKELYGNEKWYIEWEKENKIK